MANKIFREMLKPQAHLNRNGFDNSYLHNFTAKIGELLPVMCLETVPGGHYEIKVSDLMRTIPMNNPAFIRANQHFELYFVPYKQLWKNWDNFYTDRKVPTSAADSGINPTAAPNTSLYNLLTQFEADKTNHVGYHVEGDLGEFIGYGCEKIANLLGYPTFNSYSYPNTATAAQIRSDLERFRPNLFRPAAYQKICFDYYRQPFYDLPQSWTAYTFNLDDAQTVVGLKEEVPYDSDNVVNRFSRMFQLHYRQYKKDLFTGVLPSTQFGAVAVVDLDLSGLDSKIKSTIPVGGLTFQADPLTYAFGEDSSVNGSVKTTSGGHLTVDDGNETQNLFISNQDEDSIVGWNHSTVDVVSSPTSSANVRFDVLSLVKSQAIQKWREITLRSGFRNTSQYEGHFGVTPIFTEKDRCVFVDSVSSPLQVNTVTNTNAGAMISDTQVPLGDLAANGTSVCSGEKTFKFDAKDFGILMCIYSVLPELTYMENGIALMNQKVLRDDFFTPEFENIGMQPITDLPLGVYFGATPSTIGYVPRYAEYKVGIDMQSIEFDDSSGYPGRFAGWSPSKWTMGGSLRNFYVSPMLYRDIFVSRPWLPDEDDAYRGTTIGSSKTDSFVHQCYFDIKSVLPMSVLGMPQY